MHVVGTAGHVDHGKSTLVQALTGIDPDRLREEKERGMTIDLGFAWLKLPSGREVSIVDVPGHERFIKNMLAGVGGIDLALLVIAADEGIMPQTSEHLAILDLLEVKSGVVAITKKDLVDDDWLELVVADVEDAIAHTSLAGAPILAMSSATGEGLSALLATLDQRLEATPPKRDIGKPRLPVDRVFSISGFGTVVTGTLIDGVLSVGQEVEIQPKGTRSRIRGLQTHKRKVDTASPGSRVAANLASLATEDLQRGQVVSVPGWLRPTTVVDVKLRLVSGLKKPMGHNAVVTFHTGAAEAVGTVRLLEKPELPPGETSWVQIKLAAPIALAKGDFFVVRSSLETLGGGVIVDPHPKRHRRFHASTLASLSTLEKGTPEEILLQSLEKSEPIELRTLLDKSGLAQDEARSALGQLLANEQAIALGGNGQKVDRLPAQTHIFSSSGWGKLAEKVRIALEAHHASLPLRAGMPKEELKSRLHLAPRLFSDVMDRLTKEGRVAEESNAYRLPSHERRLSAAQQAEATRYLQAISSNPFAPPSDLTIDAEILGFLADEKEVVKVTESVVFSAKAYEEMRQRIIDQTRQKGTITVAEVRDMFGTSRKYALALLEHLDEQRITRRVGDERVLR